MRRYRDAERKSKYLQEHVDYLREQSTSLQRKLDGMPRGTQSRDRMVDIVTSIADEEAAALDQVGAVHEVRRELMGVIDRLPDERVRMAMFLRYIRLLPDCDIYDRLDCSSATVYRLIREGLAIVEQQCAVEIAACGIQLGAEEDDAAGVA